MIRRTIEEGEYLSVEDLQDILATNEDAAIIQDNRTYYNGQNPFIYSRFRKGEVEGKNPNNLIASPYASTLTDSASSYSFSDIKRVADDKEYDLEGLNDILYYNDADVKDLQIGIEQLGIGVCYVIHYVDNEGDTKEYKFEIADQLNCTAIYSPDLSQKLIAFIYNPHLKEKNVITVYYDDIVETYLVGDNDSLNKLSSLPNDYEQVPVEVYYFKKGHIESLFTKVKSYINAIDTILTGNWNENEKFAEAVLIITKMMKQEDIDMMKDNRVLANMPKEDADAIRYLTKTSDTEFQRFIYDTCVLEIHKATHIIDFFNPEAGITNVSSGTALQIRLYDMLMNARRYEGNNKNGQYKRISLLNTIAGLGLDDAKIQIVYEHNLPSDMFNKITALKDVTFISNQSKNEMIGLDGIIEAERIAEENTLLLPEVSDNIVIDEVEDDIE